MPKKLEEIHKGIVESMHGKINPKTKKPFTDNEMWAMAQSQYKKMMMGEGMKETHLEFYSNLELKEENGEFYSEGFVATTHPDRAEKGKFKGDILTKSAISKIVDDINSNKNMMANLASYRHDWVKEDNPELPAVGRAIVAEVRELPNGHAGAWVKTHHNKSHPRFDNIKYEVENKYLPGYSIEFEAKSTKDAHLSDGIYRVIDNLDLFGYGFANGRNIANPKATITNFGYKELMDATESKENNEVHTMTENNAVQPELKEKVEIDIKEYEQYQKFAEMQIKEKKETEMKELVKAELAKLMPSNSPKMNPEYKELSASLEYKEWKEMSGENVSIREAFNRATALATKTGAFNRAYEKYHSGLSVFGTPKPMQFKCAGINTSNIEIKAPLESDTNQSTDTDYLRSAAELSELYAPAIVKMLNQRTTLFGLLPKVDFSGKPDIAWRAENVANSASSYLEGAAVTKSHATRQKLREVFKFYQIGIQVTGQMIESARSGIGDIFQAEVESATRALLSKMNQDLFGTSGAFSDTAFLGLEYIATSSTYTTLYGLTRSTTNLLGASNSEFAAQSSAEISKPVLRTAIRTLEVNGANRNELVIVCHPLQRDKILALVDDAQRMMSNSPSIGFVGQPSFDGVPVFSDKDANNDDVFVLNLGENGLRMGVQVPVRFEDLAKTDDSRSAFLKFYGNMYALAPKQSVYMIQGLSTS